MQRRGESRTDGGDRSSTRRAEGSPARRRLGLAAVVAAVALTAAACFPVAAPAPAPTTPKPTGTTTTTAAPAPAQLSIAPGIVDFADDPRPGGEVQAFVVSNVGGSTSGVLGAPFIVAGGAPEFSVDAGTCDDGAGTLAAGAQCTIDVTFTADEGGGNVVAPTSVSIAATPGGTVTAELTGTEHDTRTLVVLGDGVPFVDSNEPDDTPTQVFTVANVSPGLVANGLVITIEDLTQSSGFFHLVDNECSTSLNPGTSCDVSVTFVDDSGSGEETTANLVVSADFADSVEFELEGQSTGEPNLMSVFPLVANITDSISESGPDATQITVMMTITNNSAVTTGLLQEELVQSPQASPFTVEDFAGDCVITPVQLDPGQSCFLMVSFDAQSGVQEELEVRVRATPGGFVRTIVFGLPVP